MNTHILKKICCGLSLFVITACTENEFLEDGLTEFELSANIESLKLDSCTIAMNSIESRTFISEDDSYESGYAMLWRTDEVIGVYGNYAKNAKFTSTNDEYAETVSFKGFMFGTPKYAYYPYSEVNDGVAATAVKASMPLLHEYSSVNKDLAGDYRAGVIDSRNWYSSKFSFKRLASTLKFIVDATDTELEGSRICSIGMKVNNERKITGEFTINLPTQSLSVGNYNEGNDSLLLQWLNAPMLMSGKSYIAYTTALPTVKSGDEIEFTITTTTHKAVFKTISDMDFQSNDLYSYLFKLNSLDNMIIEELNTDEDEEPVVTPSGELVINSLKFTVIDNPGKILPGKVIYGQNYSETITEQVCNIDEENHKISLYLPYLNNRKLIPTYEVPEGCFLMTKDGTGVISGETEVDFSVHNQLAVVNSNATDIVIYDIELTNTGLPVVVINQQTGVTSTESESNYEKGSAAWYKATGTMWQPKSSDWVKTDGVDNFMVYNADGTPAITNKGGLVLTEPILASTRVRGNVTQQMPKKAFAVKLDAKSGVLDMPAHKRWVLLANWKDRTLMRNDVAFGIADVFNQIFPNDGLAWNPSGQFVELVYNGVHVGNYYLCEQIKIDGNRLDINDPYETPEDGEVDSYSGNPADYGYLLECDDAYDETWKFTTANYIPFLFKDDGNNEMLAYAQNLVRGVEDNLYAGNYTTAYEKLDLTSLVDYWLIQELMMNSEMQHPKSVYMYINNDKLYAGPIWDFDWNTLPVSTSFSEEGYSYTKSMLEKANYSHKSSGYPDSPKDDSDANYMWYPLLVKDATFKAMAAERWNAVNGALRAYVSSLSATAQKLKVSEAENWSMWELDERKYSSSFMVLLNERGQKYGIGGGFCGDEGMSFEDAVNQLQTTLNTRISGMNYVSTQTWPNK